MVHLRSGMDYKHIAKETQADWRSAKKMVTWLLWVLSSTMKVTKKQSEAARVAELQRVIQPEEGRT